MAITSNTSGVLKTLNVIHANVSGTLKELEVIHANVSGTLKQIHTNEKCLDINFTSLSPSKEAKTYYGTTSPSDLSPCASLYVPDLTTPLRVITDLSVLPSDFDSIKNSSTTKKDAVDSSSKITFVSGALTGGVSGKGGGGSVLILYAEKDGAYLRFYFLPYTFSWSQTSQSYTVSNITTPLKAKLYYK